EGDMQIARAILAEAEAQASKAAVAFLEQEFSNIDRLIASVGGNHAVVHEITLPYGCIRVTIDRSARMSEEKEERDLVRRDEQTQLQKPQSVERLLQDALQH